MSQEKSGARIGGLSCPPDYPRSLLIGICKTGRLRAQQRLTPWKGLSVDSVPSPPGCLRATSEFLFLATRGAAADEAGGSSAGKGITMATFEQAVGTGVRNVRTLTRDSLHPIPQWVTLEGGTTAVLMVDHDDAKQASGQCARACGVLTRVRSACLWRAQRACATPLPQGGAKSKSSARGQRGVDGRARRRKAGLRALRLFLRAGSEQGPARVDSVTSQCVLPPLPRRHLSMLTKCTRLHWLRRWLPIF